MKLSFALLALFVLAGIPLACSSNPSTPSPNSTPTFTPTFTPTGSPTATNSPTATPTNTPVPVGVTFGVIFSSPSYHYAVTGVTVSAPVTISVGTSAVWDSSNAGIHPLYLDNGTSSCLLAGNLSFPTTQVLGIGTYHFHCGNHGSCNLGASNTVCPNTNCTGMAVTLIVQ